MSNITRTTTRSWGSRIGGSFKGLLLAPVLVIAGIVLLFVNENRAVKTARDLSQGAREVVSAGSDSVDPANEGGLVHFMAATTTDDLLQDEMFGVEAQGLMLRRKVEMYQWEQQSTSRTETKLGGSEETVTEYSYRKVWSDRLIDSSGFENPAPHQNPGQFPVEGTVDVAADVRAGAFRLPSRLIKKLSQWQPHRVAADAGGAAVGEAGFVSKDGGFYRGENPASPAIGDVRVSFDLVPLGTVSVISRQLGDTLEPFTGKAGTSIDMITLGEQSAAAMFEQAEKANRMMTWILRAVGFVLILVGFNMLFAPLGVFGDVLPILGRIARFGTGLVSFLLAAPLALVTIAIAWLAVRPLLSVGLLVAAAVIAFGLLRLRKGRGQPLAA